MLCTNAHGVDPQVKIGMDFISETFKNAYPEHFGGEVKSLNGKILYQYQKIRDEHLETILSGQIYISNPNTFNDPFDCWGMLENDTPQVKDIDVNFCERMLNEGSNELGIICMCGNWESQLMWSHYADSHKGICLGYEIRESEWKGGDDFVLRPVQYRKLSPIPMSKAWGNLETFLPSDEAADAILRTKNPEWHYEREWRVMCKSRYRGKRVPLGQLGIQLKEVIFGMKVPSWKVSALSAAFQISGQKLSLSRIVYDRNALAIGKVAIDSRA